MKNYLIVGLVLVVAAQAFGIGPVQRVVNEAINRGTLKGVESCMDYSKSNLLSQEALRTTCVQSFHTPLYDPDLADGQAGPRIDQGMVAWGGTLENKTPDHVTTWVKLSVSFFDTDGKEKEYFAETPIWIDPMGKAEFKVDMPDLKPEQFNVMEFCDLDDPKPKNCMAWGVTGVMGLAI